MVDPVSGGPAPLAAAPEAKVSRSVLNKSKDVLSRVAVTVAVAAAPSLVHAGGFHNQERSVRGLGRAYSGEAADTGAASLAWNPAAIARSGREVYVDAHGRFFETRLTDAGSDITRPGQPVRPVGGSSVARNPTKNDVPVNAVVVVPVNDSFALGFSAGSPFLLRTDFNSDFWGRYDTLNAKIDVTELQGTAALRVNDWLDLGLGVSANYTEALLATALPNLSPLLPDGRSQVSGDAWNYGWTVGAQAHGDRGSVGLSYRSAVEHDLDAQISISGLLGPIAAGNMTGPGSATFTTPWIASLSGRWQLTPELTLNAQAQRFGWSEYDAIRIAFTGGGETIRQNYSDTTTVGVGADYQVSPILMLRGGVQFDETPTPDTLREPGVPDSDRVLYAAGGSLQLRPSIALDAALGYIAFKGDRIFEDSVFYAGTGADTSTRVRGNAKGHGVIASAGLRWKF